MLQTDTSVIFLTTFCPFTPLATGEKKAWRYYQFAIVYHKWQSYDDCFQRYGAQQTEFFAIFCPFTPLTTRKIKILIKWKRHLEISSFHTSVPKITIISYAVTEIWHVTDVIFIFHFGLILPFYLPRLLILPSYLPNNPKIKL